MTVIQRPSPNFDARPDGTPVWILVLHYTGMKTGEEAMQRLTDPAARVSSHYTVEEDGRVFQHVAEDKRAWHAGVSFWCGETNVNASSIGIEIVNPGHEFGLRPFPDAQIAAVIALSSAIMKRNRIPQIGVVGHSDVAPMRKDDPGELFPWKRLAQAGIGLWPGDWRRDGGPAYALGHHHGRIRQAQRALAFIGYDTGIHGRLDAKTAACVRAFQRRYRQTRCDGVLDGETRGLIYAAARMAARGA